MLLIVLTLFSIWLIPSVKIYGQIAVWHVLLLMTLFYTYIARDKLNAFVKVVKANSKFLLILLIFPLFASIRDFFGGNLSAILSNYILRGVGGLLFALCLATYFVPDNKKRLFIIMLGSIFACQALIGILQIVKPDIFFQLPARLAQQAGVQVDYTGGGPSGIFINHHIFNQHMLGLSSIFLAGIFFAAKKNKIMPGPLFFLSVTPLGIIAILASFSRGAYIGLIINIFIISYFLVKYKKISKRLLVISAFLLIFILLLAISFNVFEKREATRLTKRGGRGDELRFDVFKSAAIALQNNPFFGIGGGTEVGDIAIHNIILKTFTYYGLIGGFIYLLFYSSLFLKISAISNKYLIYKIGLLLWLVSYLVYGMGHTSAFWTGGLIEWTFVGLMLSLTQLDNRVKSLHLIQDFS